MPVLAVAVGIYLPLGLTVPIMLGGLVAHFGKGTLRRGVLAASGFIAGEALMGILLAIPFAWAQNTDILRIAPTGFTRYAQPLGSLLLVGLMLWLYRVHTAGQARR